MTATSINPTPADALAATPLRRRRIAVVVLGDVTRSPRMRYHASALAAADVEVDLVGYKGRESECDVSAQSKIHCHFLPKPLPTARYRRTGVLFLLTSLIRIVLQSARLFWCLVWTLPAPDTILVQCPPAIPTLLVVLVAARLRGAQLVIDWHNFGYAMLALALGQSHPIVTLARWYEGSVGRCAQAHLCVSRAMQTMLAQQWGISATVLHDLPAQRFAPTPLPVRRELFRRLATPLTAASLLYDPSALDRPALIVSATSWTVDEDFSLLLAAVVRCDSLIGTYDSECPHRPFPHLLIVITGDGPLRARYEQRIRQLSLRKIYLCTLWLSADDYALLLGAADLGLCLHRSASGVDLPMKIADMFGAGIPVCALDYGPCLSELVRHGENGVLFANDEQLARSLCELFREFPSRSALLDQLRWKVQHQPRERWDEAWARVARPIILADERAAAVV